MRKFKIPAGRVAKSPAFYNRKKGKFRIWPLLIFAAFAFYYYNSNSSKVPITGRNQIVDVSQDQEVALGLSSYKSILSQEQIITSGSELQKIIKITEKIIKATGKLDLPWEVNLIQSEQANAFALPGGKIAVYTGILPIVKNEDGLAAVIGHEISHVIARHGAERMTKQKLLQYGQMALGMSVGEMDAGTQRMVMGAFGLGAQYGYVLPFSRDHETEADYMGLVYLARACFDPEEAPKLWERMGKMGGKKPPEFMSTHPAPERRASNFVKWMPEALKIKSNHCAK